MNTFAINHDNHTAFEYQYLIFFYYYLTNNAKRVLVIKTKTLIKEFEVLNAEFKLKISYKLCMSI